MSEYTCPGCGHGRGVHTASGCGWCDCGRSRAALLADGIRLGEQARDAGLTQVLEGQGAEGWKDQAQQWVAQLPAGQRFTSADLVDSIGMPDSANAVGAVVRGCAVAGLIQRTGDYQRSARPQRHAGTIAVWVRL